MYILPEDINQIKISKETEIILMKPDQDIILDILVLFPGGITQEFQGFWIYKINKLIEGDESACDSCQN